MSVPFLVRWLARASWGVGRSRAWLAGLARSTKSAAVRVIPGRWLRVLGINTATQMTLPMAQAAVNAPMFGALMMRAVRGTPRAAYSIAKLGVVGAGLESVFSAASDALGFGADGDETAEELANLDYNVRQLRIGAARQILAEDMAVLAELMAGGVAVDPSEADPGIDPGAVVRQVYEDTLDMVALAGMTEVLRLYDVADPELRVARIRNEFATKTGAFEPGEGKFAGGPRFPDVTQVPSRRPQADGLGAVDWVVVGATSDALRRMSAVLGIHYSAAAKLVLALIDLNKAGLNTPDPLEPSVRLYLSMIADGRQVLIG
jgi:hypothetical protein